MASTDFNGDTRLDLVMTNGTSFSLSVVLSTVPLPVALTQHPAGASAAAEQGVSFSVGATARRWSFQRRKNGVNLANGGAVSGSDTAVLTINPVSGADNGAAFDCIVSNGCGAVRSDPAGLAVQGGCGSADFNGYLVIPANNFADSSVEVDRTI